MNILESKESQCEKTPVAELSDAQLGAAAGGQAVTCTYESKSYSVGALVSMSGTLMKCTAGGAWEKY